jgi:hypothetical protein
MKYWRQLNGFKTQVKEQFQSSERGSTKGGCKRKNGKYNSSFARIIKG